MYYVNVGNDQEIAGSGIGHYVVAESVLYELDNLQIFQFF